MNYSVKDPNPDIIISQAESQGTLTVYNTQFYGFARLRR